MKFIFILIFTFTSFEIFAHDGHDHRDKKSRRNNCYNMGKGTESCMMEFKSGIQEKRCNVCRENKSCFISLDGVERGLCEAYKEGKSCFMALNGVDRDWCGVIKDGKSCSTLSGKNLQDCEDGEYPTLHRFWSNE